MSKTQKELAFLRDLSVTKDWTDRFTNFADKHLKLPDEGNLLYYNAGTLAHALELREKLEQEVKLTCVCDDTELEIISEAKATAIKANIKFSRIDELESETFDSVLADLSFVRPDLIGETLDDLLFLTKKGGNISFFLPTAGSFGEIFSFLGETFLEHNLIEKSGEIERLIAEISTVSEAKETAREAGMKGIESETSNEIFEYDSGGEFISSTLVSDFLFPGWMNFLSEKEQKQTLKSLAQAIDREHAHLTFRFSVKATVISGVKG
jgi:hypothetical protein